jgi:hypothetical protein
MLRYLRSQEADRLLWIDGACINQKDTGEKERQVAMMGDIYCLASRVLVWVGPASSNQNEPDEDDGLLSPEPYLQRDRTFLNRDWFHRRWVIQEVALARSAVLVNGHYNEPFEIFVKIMSNRLTNGFVELSETEREILRRLRTILDLQGLRFMERAGELLELLVEMHAAECSDPRDRVYALMSLTPTPLSVDYRQAPEQLYTTLALGIFTTRPSALLSCAGAFRSNSPINLPSWVPDWRARPVYKPFVLAHDIRNLSGKEYRRLRPSEATLVDNKPTVSLSLTEGNSAVLRVDMLGVVWIAMETGECREGPGNISLEYASSFYNKHHIWSGSESTEFTDTLTLGHCKYHSNEWADRIVDFVGETTINRTCFFTHAGNFGLGPQDLHTGDVLVRVPGGRVLIALRPTTCKFTGEVRDCRSGNLHMVQNQDTFWVVGDCFVPNLMRQKPGIALGGSSQVIIV